jgi:hypothetical protein
MSPIDLDLEAIELDGGWHTRDQLISLIKSKLDAHDYCVSKPAEALAQLTSTLAGVRSFTLRVMPQVADAVAQAATRRGKSEASIVREALLMYFDLSDTAGTPARAQEPAAAIAGRANRPVAGTAIRPQ